MLEGTKIYLLNFTFLQAGTWYGSLVIRDISETYRIRSRVMITRTTKAGHPFIFYYLIFPVSKLLWNMPLTGLTTVAIWGLIVNQATIFIFFGCFLWYTNDLFCMKKREGCIIWPPESQVFHKFYSHYLPAVDNSCMILERFTIGPPCL